MLRKLTYRFTSIILLVPFIAASTGISIFFHKCSCEQRLITTLFVEHKCHEVEAPSCCETALDGKTAFAESDCGCKTERFTIKIDDILNSSNYTSFETKLHSFQINKISLLGLEISNSNQDLINLNSLYIPDESPPLKQVGRALIILLHQSKTDNLIS